MNLYAILIVLLLLEKGMADSFEQNQEIIIELNGWLWILENYYSFKVLTKRVLKNYLDFQL